MLHGQPRLALVTLSKGHFTAKILNPDGDLLLEHTLFQYLQTPRSQLKKKQNQEHIMLNSKGTSATILLLLLFAGIKFSNFATFVFSVPSYSLVATKDSSQLQCHEILGNFELLYPLILNIIN